MRTGEVAAGERVMAARNAVRPSASAMCAENSDSPTAYLPVTTNG